MEVAMDVDTPKEKKVRVKKEKIIDLSQEAEPKEKSSKGKKKKADEGDPNEPIFREIRRQQLFQILRNTLAELEELSKV